MSSLPVLLRRAVLVATQRAAPGTPAIAVATRRVFLSTKAFAVDSPDGVVDGDANAELLQVSKLIEEEAKYMKEHPDELTRIVRDREAMAKTEKFAVDRPDGENDADWAEEVKQVTQLIEDEAEYLASHPGELERIKEEHRVEAIVKEEFTRRPGW